MSWLEGPFEYLTLDAVKIAKFSRVLVLRPTYIVNKTTPKLTSAPPHGGAQEPSMQLLAFHWDCTDRLLEQTQRHMYGCAAPALRHSGTKKFLLGGWAPAEAYKHYYVFIYISGTPESRLLKRRPPFTSYMNTYTTERAACGNWWAANSDWISHI